MLENNILASGVYRIKYDKVVNSTIEEVVRAKDQIRVSQDCNPVGDIFGLHIYEATHLKTNQKIYVSAEELM